MAHHCLRVIEVDFPPTSVRELEELLAIHDGVGPGLKWHASLDGDVVGEVERPGSGSISAIRRRSTTSWSAAAVTAMAQPR